MYVTGETEPLELVGDIVITRQSLTSADIHLTVLGAKQRAHKIMGKTNQIVFGTIKLLKILK